MNQHIGIIYRNERSFADMVYTNGVRISVARRIFREKLGIDDVAFDALVDQELARRKAEEDAAKASAEEAFREKTAVEKAKELGVKMDKGHESTVEDIEFGGDFGEEKHAQGVEEKAGDQDPAGHDGGGPGVDEGAVEDS